MVKSSALRNGAAILYLFHLSVAEKNRKEKGIAFCKDVVYGADNIAGRNCAPSLRT